MPDERNRALAYAVRMGMGAAESQPLGEVLQRCPEAVAERLQDQLWLRSVFVEQRRRTEIAERDRFDARADHVLEALDPQAHSFDALVAVAQQILYPAALWERAG